MANTNKEELYALGHIIWILLLTLLTFGYVTVGLRLWVRFRITKSPGWDDATMVLTLVSVFLHTGRALLTTPDAVHCVLCGHHEHRRTSI